MDRKLAMLIISVALLGSVLNVPLEVQKVKASGTIIYIKADGSIDPPDAPILTIDNVTYTLIDDIISDIDGIVIERDNITLNGAGYTIQGTGAYLSMGINLHGRSNVTVKNIEIQTFWTGIDLSESGNSSIFGNSIINNVLGINLQSSSNSSISGNIIMENDWIGIQLDKSLNNSITANNITTSSKYGIWLIFSSDGNNIFGNNITNSGHGIGLDQFVNNNNIVRNDITNNSKNGIYLLSSSANHILGNRIAKNSGCGIYLDNSPDNVICHNNFVSNKIQANVTNELPNIWDDGYPSGGNYWSDYNGTDLYSGPYQNETSSDGISDTHYIISANNTDNYPLIGMFFDFNATWQEETFHVNVISNSTVSNFDYGEFVNLETGESWKAIHFQVEGPDDTTGFCRICIPTALMNGTYRVFINSPYMVFINWTEVPYTLLPYSNSTHSYLYFTYHHSTKGIIIIPEFPSIIILPLFMMATLLVVKVCKRKRSMYSM